MELPTSTGTRVDTDFYSMMVETDARANKNPPRKCSSYSHNGADGPMLIDMLCN